MTRQIFMGFGADPTTRATIGQAAQRAGLPTDQVLQGTLQDAHDALTTIQTPEILVIDVAASPDPIESLNELADVCDEGTKVVVLGEINDVRVYRDLLAFGVYDYFVKPAEEAALAETLAKARAAEQKPTAAKPVSPLVVFFGARGGVGASSIALNCAWIAAHERQRRVAFVDMDMHFGTAALALDLEPEHGFRDLIENPERIDDLFIQRAMIRATDNLSLLSSEEDLSRPMVNGVKAYGTLLGALRQRFETVVVDLPRALAPTHADVLAQASAIGIVADMTLHSLRDVLRLVALAEAHAPEATIRILVNENAGTRAGSLDRTSFARGLERPIDVVIPQDSKAFSKGQTKGRTLVQAAPKSRVAAAMRAVTDQMIGAEEAPAGMWARLFKTGRR